MSVEDHVTPVRVYWCGLRVGMAPAPQKRLVSASPPQPDQFIPLRLKGDLILWRKGSNEYTKELLEPLSAGINEWVERLHVVPEIAVRESFEFSKALDLCVDIDRCRDMQNFVASHREMLFNRSWVCWNAASKSSKLFAQMQHASELDVKTFCKCYSTFSDESKYVADRSDGGRTKQECAVFSLNSIFVDMGISLQVRPRGGQARRPSAGRLYSKLFPDIDSTVVRSVAIVGENGVGKSTAAELMRDAVNHRYQACGEPLCCGTCCLLLQSRRLATHADTNFVEPKHDADFRLLAAEHQRCLSVRDNDTTTPHSKSHLDIIRPLWRIAFPSLDLHTNVDELHVRADVHGQVLLVYSRDYDCSYLATSMSDGEKALLRLLCRLAEEYAERPRVVLIDEPELHLHPGLAAVFWRAVEKTFTCDLFLYFTHNILFAAPHHNAFRIGLMLSFLGEHDLNAIDKVPDEDLNDVQRLLLSVLGEEDNAHCIMRELKNRRGVFLFETLEKEAFAQRHSSRLLGLQRLHVVFVEGSATMGLDARLYELLLGDESVVLAVGSCEDVKNGVANARISRGDTLTATPIRYDGLVDYDYGEHGDERNAAYHVSPLCCVENFYMVPELLRELYGETCARLLMETCVRTIMTKEKREQQQELFRKVRGKDAPERHFSDVDGKEVVSKYENLLMHWKTKIGGRVAFLDVNCDFNGIAFDWNAHTTRVIRRLMSDRSADLLETLRRRWVPPALLKRGEARLAPKHVRKVEKEKEEEKRKIATLHRENQELKKEVERLKRTVAKQDALL